MRDLDNLATEYVNCIINNSKLQDFWSLKTVSLYTQPTNRLKILRNFLNSNTQFVSNVQLILHNVQRQWRDNLTDDSHVVTFGLMCTVCHQLAYVSDEWCISFCTTMSANLQFEIE